MAYGAMSPENLKAVALVVRIVRELDRYHGFVAAGRRARRDPGPVEAEGERLVAIVETASPPPPARRASEGTPGRSPSPAPLRCAGEDSAGAGHILPRGAPAERGRGTTRSVAQGAGASTACGLGGVDRPEMAPQVLEKMESAPGQERAPARARCGPAGG